MTSLLTINNYMPKELYSCCAEVGQQCMSITHSNDDKYCLGTFGMGNCISLLGYCNDTKVGFLTHLDLEGLVDDFGKIYYNLDKISQNKNRKIKMKGYLVGGDKHLTSSSFVDKIESRCNSLNSCWKDSVEINIDSYALYENNPSSVALDTKNGNMYLYDGMLSQAKNRTEKEDKLSVLFMTCNSYFENPSIRLSYCAK